LLQSVETAILQELQGLLELFSLLPTTALYLLFLVLRSSLALGASRKAALRYYQWCWFRAELKAIGHYARGS
jgi:hypothetical protein